MQIDRETLEEVEAALGALIAQSAHCCLGFSIGKVDITESMRVLSDDAQSAARVLARLRKAMEDGKDG